VAPRWPRWSSLSLPLLLTAFVVAVGLASVWSRSRLGIDIWLPDLATGLTLAMAGAVISIVDRGSRLGVIVELAAFAWFLPNFRTAAFGPLALLATSALLLHRAVLFHAIVAFPRGRVTRMGERIIIVLAYASSLGALALPAIVWSVAALMAFVAIVITRTGPTRDAGGRALPTMVLFGFVIGSTNLFRLLVGDPSSRLALVHAYEAGVAAVGVVLTVSVIRYRSRLAGLTAAVVELTQGRAGYLRDLLATALRDPSVEVAFAVDGAGATTWVDELGRPIDTLQATGTRTVIPIRVDGRPVAELACESYVADEPALRQSIETAARLAASNARLRAGLRSEAEELRASQLRLLSAADDQRVALAQQLERGAGASLLEVGPLLDAVPAEADPAVRAAVDRSRARSEGLVAGLRSLSAGLGPADLRNNGLENALSQLGAGFEGRFDLDMNAPDLPDGLAAATYFICAEGIANAMKHASATEVCVTVEQRGDRVVISIVDDGPGGASIEAGSGLRGLADRAAALGGSLSIVSPPDAGTRITVDLPLG
jgi:signal transduction histidine kinase